MRVQSGELRVDSLEFRVLLVASLGKSASRLDSLEFRVDSLEQNVQICRTDIFMAVVADTDIGNIKAFPVAEPQT